MFFEAEVRDLASDGRGIVATPEGLTCFVAGVWLGERARFKLLPKKKVQEAQLVELLEAAPQRREAPCKFHGHDEQHCGGCAWQFMDYAAQLKAKQERVQAALTRLQKNINLKPVVAAPQEFFYRNRAQLKTDGTCIGFEAANSNNLVGIDDCLVLSEKNRSSLQALLTQLPNKAWQSRPQKKHSPKGKGKAGSRQRWVTLDIDESISADQVSINQRLPFQQGNSVQNLYIQNWLAKQTETLDLAQTVLELFCGSGNFTQVLANRGFNRIFAVELDVRAVAELDQKNLPGTEAITCNLYEETALQALSEKVHSAELLVLDPPRDGFKQLGSFCEGLRKLKKILYISCDLATFVRDAQAVIALGYVLEEVQPVDLFPQTPHIELLGVFSSS